METPRDVIPELEDVEDPQEMVNVLLNVGEERSRKNDVKGALAAFNKAIALDPSSDMAWFNRGVLLEAEPLDLVCRLLPLLLQRFPYRPFG